MIKKKSRALRALIGAGSTLALLNPALMLAADSESMTAAPEPEELVVTGSRIRGVAPVGGNLIEVGRMEIDTSSSVSATELLREVPQVVNLGADESHKGSQNAQLNTSFASGVNLRGIGGSTTLLLLNGHRIAPSGTQGQYTDPSIIPGIALERMEVMADGASAIYGSDAVAGVVNLITRSGFNGAETRARYGVADGADRMQLSQLFGTSWSSGDVMVALERTERSKLEARDRPFYREDLTELGGSNYGGNLCNPGTLVVGGVTYALPSGSGIGIDPDTLVPGTQNRCDLLTQGWLLPKQERSTVFLDLNQDLTDRVTLNLQTVFSKREFEFVEGGRTASITVRDTNPYFISPLPGATSVSVNYMFPEDFGPKASSGSAQVFQTILGLDIDLWGDWRGNVSGVYGKSRDEINALNLVDAGNMAISAASADPALAINPFGSDANPASVYDFIRGRTLQKPSTTMKMAELQADGSLFDLPGGAVRLAIGAEYRTEELETPFITYRPGAPTDTRVGLSDRTIKSGYAELFVPLFGRGNAVTGLERLELSIAYRHDRYDDFGSTTNPKYGLTWAPTNDLVVRASYGESFRAPNMAELDVANIAIYQRSKIDPTSPSGTSLGILLAGGNPNLDPETAKSWTFGLDYTPAFAPGFAFSSSFFSVEYSGQVVDLFAVNDVLVEEQFYGAFVTRNPSMAQIQALLNSGYRISGTVNPATTTFIIDARRQNLAITEAEGYDFKVRYNRDLGTGTLAVGTSGTYFTKYDTSAAPGMQTVDRLDQINYPVDLVLRGDIGWSDATWGTRLSVAYISGYLNTVATPAQRVGSYTTADLYVGYTFGEAGGSFLDGLALSLDVQNLFDEEPNFVNIPGGYDAEKASALGRLISIGLTKRW